MRRRYALVSIILMTSLCASALLAEEGTPETFYEIAFDAWALDFTGLQERLAEHDLDNNGYANDNAPVFLKADDPDAGLPLRLLYMRGEYGFSLSYFKAETTGDVSVLDVTNGFLVSQLDPYYDWAGIVNWIGGKIESDATEWSLHYVNAFHYENADTYWRMMAGVSFMDYTEDNIHDYDDTASVPPESWYRVQNHSEFSGWGPSAGLEFSHRVGHIEGFSFRADAGVCYIQGDSKYRHTEIYDPRDVIGSYAALDVGSERDESVLRVGGGLELCYRFDFGLGIKAGYRFVRWDNLPNTPLSTDYYMYALSERTRDVSVNGFMLGVSYRWGTR